MSEMTPPLRRVSALRFLFTRITGMLYVHNKTDKMKYAYITYRSKQPYVAERELRLLELTKAAPCLNSSQPYYPVGVSKKLHSV